MNKFVNPDAGTTTIIANGQPRSVKAGSTIADLLQELNIAPMRVVTQLDGVIVSRSEFDKAVLQEGCKLEIVTMVGGGEVGLPCCSEYGTITDNKERYGRRK